MVRTMKTAMTGVTRRMTRNCPLGPRPWATVPRCVRTGATAAAVGSETD